MANCTRTVDAAVSRKPCGRTGTERARAVLGDGPEKGEDRRANRHERMAQPGIGRHHVTPVRPGTSSAHTPQQEKHTS
ncbi:hypothetical protein GCM10023347_26800 [Streptomyces chumphonensis]